MDLHQMPGAACAWAPQSAACARLRRFYSEPCVRAAGGRHERAAHKSSSSDDTFVSLNRTHAPATRVLEDRCTHPTMGRTRLSGEVVVIPQWRLIYIDNKKAGSSTINVLLEKCASLVSRTLAPAPRPSRCLLQWLARC
jgi:hypothetical protein